MSLQSCKVLCKAELVVVAHNDDVIMQMFSRYNIYYVLFQVFSHKKSVG